MKYLVFFVMGFWLGAGAFGGDDEIPQILLGIVGVAATIILFGYMLTIGIKVIFG